MDVVRVDPRAIALRSTAHKPSMDDYRAENKISPGNVRAGVIKAATNFADGGVTRLRDASAEKVTRKEVLECKVGLRRRQNKKPSSRGFIRREREREKEMTTRS